MYHLFRRQKRYDLYVFPACTVGSYFNMCLLTCNKLLTQKLLKQGYRYHKLRKTFSKFYRRYYDLISKFQVGLKSLLPQGLSEPNFYGDLVIKRLAITLMYCNRLHAW